MKKTIISTCLILLLSTIAVKAQTTADYIKIDTFSIIAVR